MKRNDISLARIIRPSFADIYQRKRLFKLLDKSRGHPVLWITGPPGYGKTILVSSFIESRNLSCLWYQADAGDGDIATFFYYMGLAARKAAPHKKKGFLSDSRGEEWGISYRERLRSKYLRFTGELGGLYEEKGDFRKAVETYQKGIESDPAAEEFYQHLMTCYQRLGRRAEAMSAYNRLKKVLSEMMGITPSPATEAIYRGLI